MHDFLSHSLCSSTLLYRTKLRSYDAETWTIVQWSQTHCLFVSNVSWVNAYYVYASYLSPSRSSFFFLFFSIQKKDYLSAIRSKCFLSTSMKSFINVNKEKLVFFEFKSSSKYWKLRVMCLCVLTRTQKLYAENFPKMLRISLLKIILLVIIHDFSSESNYVLENLYKCRISVNKYRAE